MWMGTKNRDIGVLSLVIGDMEMMKSDNDVEKNVWKMITKVD